jgi:hypothetical protein
MASQYPGALDTLSTSHSDGTNEIIHAADIDDLADAVNKIEAELGVLPKGTFVDVATRLSSGETLTTVLGNGNDAGGLLISNLADPISSTDAATKEYVDNAVFNTAVASATYTLVLADSGCVVSLTSTSATTVTIPPFVSVPFAGGVTIMLRQFTATGTVTVAAGAGVTIQSRGNSVTLAGQYAAATLIRIPTAANSWWLFGDLA